MEKIVEKIKAVWANPIAKTAIMGAMGAAGGIMATGTFVVSKATITASLVGAGTAIWGLFVQHPTKPGA